MCRRRAPPPKDVAQCNASWPSASFLKRLAPARSSAVETQICAYAASEAPFFETPTAHMSAVAPLASVPSTSAPASNKAATQSDAPAAAAATRGVHLSLSHAAPGAAPRRRRPRTFAPSPRAAASASDASRGSPHVSASRQSACRNSRAKSAADRPRASSRSVSAPRSKSPSVAAKLPTLTATIKAVWPCSSPRRTATSARPVFGRAAVSAVEVLW
mmetsp:Transcript_23754/g.84783  ORF Transcript_23754/g.84783 Transcript_23754/m.84783 type:complete len:216 (+) Transcript_23754:175-822(+)